MEKKQLNKVTKVCEALWKEGKYELELTQDDAEEPFIIFEGWAAVGRFLKEWNKRYQKDGYRLWKGPIALWAEFMGNSEDNQWHDLRFTTREDQEKINRQGNRILEQRISKVLDIQKTYRGFLVQEMGRVPGPDEKIHPYYTEKAQEWTDRVVKAEKERKHKELQDIYTRAVIQSMFASPDKQARYPVWLGHPYYQVPENLDDFGKIGLEFGFSDEYTTCSQCSSLIRTSPDSYGWVASHIDTEYDGPICLNCLQGDRFEDFIEHYKNHNRIFDPWNFSGLLKEDGWVRLDEEFQWSMHHDYANDPKKIIKALNSSSIDVMFEGHPSQFEIDWFAWVKHQEEDFKGDLGFMAGAILSESNTRLDYGPASALKRALSGDNSGPIVMKSVVVTEDNREAFINGTLLKGD